MFQPRQVPSPGGVEKSESKKNYLFTASFHGEQPVSPQRTATALKLFW
jgi:hypothetical protein